MRITKAFVRARFERVAEIFGWNTEAYREGKAQVGAVILDHAACYGGYRLDYIANSGGQGHLFGRSDRMSAAEMVAYLRGLEDGATHRHNERAEMVATLRAIVFQALQGPVLYRDACVSKAHELVNKAEGRSNG